MALIETHRFGVDLPPGGAVKGKQLIVEVVDVGSSLGAEIGLFLRVLGQVVESGGVAAFSADDKLQRVGAYRGLSSSRSPKAGSKGKSASP